MHDLIYRQEAIDAMHQYSYFNDFDVSVIDEDIAVIALKDLSSAQPYTDEEIQKMQDIEQAQLDKAYEMGKADALRWIPCADALQWISCSDGLPEYGEAVLTINEDEDYEVNHIIDEDTGEWFYEGAIAWMPLPPYKEG